MGDTAATSTRELLARLRAHERRTRRLLAGMVTGVDELGARLCGECGYELERGRRRDVVYCSPRCRMRAMRRRRREAA